MVEVLFFSERNPSKSLKPYRPSPGTSTDSTEGRTEGFSVTRGISTLGAEEIVSKGLGSSPRPCVLSRA